MLTIILSLLLSIQSAEAVDCGKHSIYCQIIKNKPSINKKYAMKLSNIIYKYSVKYKIPKNVFTAILMQESQYNIKAKNCYKGIYEPEIKTASTDDIELVEGKVCTDFGISQIWYRTVNRYDFDIAKLTNDLDYSVRAGAVVLGDFKKRHKKEKNWWARYNCGSKPSINRITCKEYINRVKRYL